MSTMPAVVSKIDVVPYVMLSLIPQKSLAGEVLAERKSVKSAGCAEGW